MKKRQVLARILRVIADELDGAPEGLAQGIADVKAGRVVDVPPETFSTFVPALWPMVYQVLQWQPAYPPHIPNPFYVQPHIITCGAESTGSATTGVLQ